MGADRESGNPWVSALEGAGAGAGKGTGFSDMRPRAGLFLCFHICGKRLRIKNGRVDIKEQQRPGRAALKKQIISMVINTAQSKYHFLPTPRGSGTVARLSK